WTGPPQMIRGGLLRVKVGNNPFPTVLWWPLAIKPDGGAHFVLGAGGAASTCAAGVPTTSVVALGGKTTAKETGT
ncbi:hypothetical protein UF38_24270, partial [Vibrio parahaemolyticus]